MKREDSMASAVEEFVGQRVIDCGKGDHRELQDGYARLEEAKEKLEVTLNKEQTLLFRELLNLYSLSDGETMQVYYRAGFGDALQFVFGWRDGDWLTDNESDNAGEPNDME